MPKYCNYFVTLKCNDTCEFCSMWQDETSQEKPATEVAVSQVLKQIKDQGVKYLNLTGGEPFLRPDLDQILKQAKACGLYTRLTTNGIEYAPKARLIAGLVDELYFSIDYPAEEDHDRSRGIECFHLAAQAVRLAEELGEKPMINFTMTRDNVRFLPEMIDLAEKLRAKIYLNPVYDFFGTQGFEPATIDYIKYYSRRKNVLADLAMLELVKAGGNNVLLPRCKASQTVLTVLPDGSFVKPCYFNQNGSGGREAICSGCMRSDYMLPSFEKGIDKYYFLHLWSTLVNGLKRRK